MLVTLALSQQNAERVINQYKLTNGLTLGLLSSTSKVSQDGGYVNAGAFTGTSPIWIK